MKRAEKIDIQKAAKNFIKDISEILKDSSITIDQLSLKNNKSSSENVSFVKELVELNIIDAFNDYLKAVGIPIKMRVDHDGDFSIAAENQTLFEDDLDLTYETPEEIEKEELLKLIKLSSELEDILNSLSREVNTTCGNKNHTLEEIKNPKQDANIKKSQKQIIAICGAAITCILALTTIAAGVMLAVIVPGPGIVAGVLVATLGTAAVATVGGAITAALVLSIGGPDKSLDDLNMKDVSENLNNIKAKCEFAVKEITKNNEVTLGG